MENNCYIFHCFKIGANFYNHFQTYRSWSLWDTKNARHIRVWAGIYTSYDVWSLPKTLSELLLIFSAVSSSRIRLQRSCPLSMVGKGLWPWCGEAWCYFEVILPYVLCLLVTYWIKVGELSNITSIELAIYVCSCTKLLLLQC